MFMTTARIAIQQVETIGNPTPEFVLKHIGERANQGYMVQAMTTYEDIMYIVFVKPEEE